MNISNKLLIFIFADEGVMSATLKWDMSAVWPEKDGLIEEQIGFLMTVVDVDEDLDGDGGVIYMPMINIGQP